MKHFLELASAGSALLAAGLWLYASRIPTPPELPIEGYSVTTVVDTVPGSQVVSPVSGYPEELRQLAATLIKQGKYNSYAATSAAASAFCQFLLYFFPHISN